MPTKLKHRWSVGHNYLAGISAGDWWRLLRENRFAVDPVYWHRAALITLASLVNSYYRRQEERRYGAIVENTAITEPPLFVLGHWRSGTTHLHNLVAQDADQFAWANTFQVVNPHTFLCTEKIHTRRFAFLVPHKRPMDNMALSFESPQEDEFAMLLRCFYSLYLGVTFPRRDSYYSRYLTFEGVPDQEIAEWKQALLWFAKKLTYLYGRTLVLKSPAHTARIKLLLDVFPEARFVHIHRNPYSVFRSSQHYFDTAAWFLYMQRPNRETVDRDILERYNVLYDSFFKCRGLIPHGNYHEMCFEDLEREPLVEMRRLYDRLGLKGFDAVEPKLQKYVASLAGYQKNEFSEVPQPLREAVATSWKRSFDEWGYSA
jgi:omega-hydroxy-beta-dihydromenaquinone-9 sulfotransferase